MKLVIEEDEPLREVIQGSVILWGGYRGQGNYEDLVRERVSLFRRFLVDLGVKDILEIGCSNGYNLKAISMIGKYKLTGIDVAPGAIERCDKTIGEFSVTNGFDLPDKKYDLILMVGFCCCFLDRWMPILKEEMIRLAKYLLIVDYKGNGYEDNWCRRDYTDYFDGFECIKFEETTEIKGFSAWLLRSKGWTQTIL